MKIVEQDGRRLAFLPTWRLVIVVGMYCVSVIQLGAFIIFATEQKPMNPVGQIGLIVGSTAFLFLGHFIGKKDLRKIREAGAVLEGTRFQIAVIILLCASVPGSLLILLLIG
jgi:hypothetical protein